VAAAHNDLSVPLKPSRVGAEVTTADEVFEIASSGAAVTLPAYPDARRVSASAARTAPVFGSGVGCFPCATW
jgi:hypothetical protein